MPHPTRILVFGQRADVMHALLARLRDAGLTAVMGSTQLATAATDFDARHFDLIGFGGGVSDADRAALTAAYRAQNPAVELVDLIAPLAVEQLHYLAGRPAGTPPQLSAVRAEPAPDGSGWQLCFTAAVALDVTATVYWYRPTAGEEVVLMGRVAAGETCAPLGGGRLGRGTHFIGVRAAGGEIAVGRFEVE